METEDRRMSIVNSYNHLVKGNGEGVRFLTQQISKVKVPPRIAFFAWEAGQKCILTIDKLMRMSKIMANGCFICMKAAKSYNDILLWYLVAYNI